MSQKKSRIFMVNQGDGSQKFGVGKYIAEMIEAATKQREKFQMVVVTIGAEVISKVQLTKKKNITYFNIPKPFLQKHGLIYGLSKQSSHAIFLILRDFFSISETDIFHFNSNMQHFLLLKIKAFTHATIIYTVHVSMWNVLYKNNEEKFLEEWNDTSCFSNHKKNILAEIKSCEKADKVIGLSNNTVDDLRKYYKVPENKLKRIFNGISSDPPKIDEKKLHGIRTNLNLKKTDFVFLFAGRVNVQKGISDLIEAFNSIQYPDHIQVKLVVVGDGSLKKELLARTEENSAFIQFLGYVPQTEIYYYYRLSDVIVIPSLYDQNPYTILEAMAYRVPMIVTNIDAFAKLKNGSVCLKVSLESETKVHILDLRAKMQLLFEKHELRNHLAQNAHQMLLDNFSAAQMFNKTYNLQELNSNILK